MRIAAGSDHAGVELKRSLVEHLVALGHQVDDLGADATEPSVDYPLYGAAVGRAVASGSSDLGLAVCGTGIGIAMAANKEPGVRAALVHDTDTARLARPHNDAYVLCLGARTTDPAVATAAVDAFLAARFSGLERYGRRLEQLAALDQQMAEAR